MVENSTDWDKSERRQYLVDIEIVFDTTVDLIDKMTNVIQNAQLAKGLSDGASASETAAGLVQLIPPLKWVKILEEMAMGMSHYPRHPRYSTSNLCGAECILMHRDE